MKNFINKAELYTQFFFQLKDYLKEEDNEKNYFYQLNLLNFERISSLFEILSNDEIEFLRIYYDETLTLKKKMSTLNLESKSKYYYTYKKLINKIAEEVRNDGVL